MITQDTLFILGAGASKPYGYSVGSELRRYICEEFPNDCVEYIENDTNYYANTPKKDLIEEFSEAFNKSAIKSIDQWLPMNPKFSEIGRQAIATCILKCEQQSRFWKDINDSSEDWYMYLYNEMVEGFSSSQSYKRFKDNKVSFITFNYDRSLEYFLYTSLINSFTQGNIEEEICGSPKQEIIPFPFVHVYGQISNPPWLGGSSYPEQVNWTTIYDRAKNIRVIGEQNEEESKSISALFSKATRIFFLGFGYALENMEALGLPATIDVNKKVYGTAMNFTEKEVKQVRTFLKKNFPIENYGELSENPVINKGKDCYQLLRHYL